VLDMTDHPVIRCAIKYMWKAFVHFVIFSLGVLVFSPTVKNVVESARGLNMTCFATF